MRETYDPAEVESVQQAHWRAKDIYRAVDHALDANGNENRNSMFARCFRTQAENCIWVTFATTP